MAVVGAALERFGEDLAQAGDNCINSGCKDIDILSVYLIRQGGDAGIFEPVLAPSGCRNTAESHLGGVAEMGKAPEMFRAGFGAVGDQRAFGLDRPVAQGVEDRLAGAHGREDRQRLIAGEIDAGKRADRLQVGHFAAPSEPLHGIGSEMCRALCM